MLLLCLIGGQADAVTDRVSDRLGEFGERDGGLQRARSLGGEFVVAASKVLQERQPGDEAVMMVDGSGAVAHSDRRRPRWQTSCTASMRGSGMGATRVSEAACAASKCAELTPTVGVELRCLMSGQVRGVGGRSLTPSFSEVFIGHPRC